MSAYLELLPRAHIYISCALDVVVIVSRLLDSANLLDDLKTATLECFDKILSKIIKTKTRPN